MYPPILPFEGRKRPCPTNPTEEPGLNGECEEAATRMASPTRIGATGSAGAGRHLN